MKTTMTSAKVKANFVSYPSLFARRNMIVAEDI